MANSTNTRAATSHIAPFGVRMQPELKERLEKAAQESGRSLNAEIVSRLQSSLGDGINSFIPEIRISLDTGDQPISWDEIHEILSAVRKNMQIDTVSLHVTVATPELVSSSKRQQETAVLAAKLRVDSAAARNAKAPAPSVKGVAKRVLRKDLKGKG